MHNFAYYIRSIPLNSFLFLHVLSRFPIPGHSCNIIHLSALNALFLSILNFITSSNKQNLSSTCVVSLFQIPAFTELPSNEIPGSGGVATTVYKLLDGIYTIHCGSPYNLNQEGVRKRCGISWCLLWSDRREGWVTEVRVACVSMEVSIPHESRERKHCNVWLGCLISLHTDWWATRRRVRRRRGARWEEGMSLWRSPSGLLPGPRGGTTTPTTWRTTLTPTVRPLGPLSKH